jgi:hypothetical protein
MKIRPLHLLAGIALWCALFAMPVLQTGCQHTVTLEQGGVYSDAYLATTDQAILDAAKTLDGFAAWYKANAAYLAKYPAVGDLAAKVTAHQNEWLRDAYAARDSYAKAAALYKAGQGTAPTTAAVSAAISVLNDVVAQINASKTPTP